jgi:hypothetical protein
VCVCVQKHGVNGMPTMLLAAVVVFSILAEKQPENDVARFVAGLAAIGMIITAIMWARI